MHSRNVACERPPLLREEGNIACPDQFVHTRMDRGIQPSVPGRTAAFAVVDPNLFFPVLN